MCPCAAVAAGSSVNHWSTAAALLASVTGVTGGGGEAGGCGGGGGPPGGAGDDGGAGNEGGDAGGDGGDAGGNGGGGDEHGGNGEHRPHKAGQASHCPNAFSGQEVSTSNADDALHGLGSLAAVYAQVIPVRPHFDSGHSQVGSSSHTASHAGAGGGAVAGAGPQCTPDSFAASSAGGGGASSTGGGGVHGTGVTIEVRTP